MVRLPVFVPRTLRHIRVSGLAASSRQIAVERIAVLLGLLIAIGPISTDIYLPAFPIMESELGGSAQATLAVWFVGLAIGQLWVGALSDRLGRRRPLLAGIGLYTLASIGCAVAGDIWSFSAFRLVAALGASASLVIPAACVRDLSDGTAAARLISRLILIMGVVPVLAPTVGGAMLAYCSWRWIFWAAALYGVVCLVLVAKLLPETLPRERRQVLSPVGMLSVNLSLLGERAFISHAMVNACGAFLVFTYLGAAPEVFIRLFGLTPPQFGVLFGINAMAMIGAAQLGGPLMRRFGTYRLLGWSVAVALVGCVAFALLSLFGPDIKLPVMAGALMVPLAALGLSGPCSTVGALTRHAHRAGAASALIGTLQYALGALAGLLIGLSSAHSARPMALMMLLGAIGMAAAARARPRHRGLSRMRAPQIAVSSRHLLASLAASRPIDGDPRASALRDCSHRLRVS